MAPVMNADSLLSNRLSRVQRNIDLAAVRNTADSDASALTSALGAVSVIGGGKNAASGQLLHGALIADLAYANAAKSAATGLTPGTATALQTAGQQAADAYQAFSAAVPTVTVPQQRMYLTNAQLVTLAGQQQKAIQAKAAKTGAIRSYVRSIDNLLRNSADTRSNLGNLISDAQSGQVDSVQASAEIQSVVSQRQDLQNQVSAVSTPTAFAAASSGLRDSISASLQDDLAIQRWINAWEAGDVLGEESAYQQHLSATSTASSAKASFLATYNRLRARYLHLPPLNVAY
jgi:hypothetical protein